MDCPFLRFLSKILNPDVLYDIMGEQSYLNVFLNIINFVLVL